MTSTKPNQPPAPPQQTLYINNLNDHVQKDELKRALYMLFSQYGPLMDIVATKVPRMRGQAFVVFKDVNAATAAMRQCQGIPLFDKAMRIAYARSKADIVSKIDGTFSQKKKLEKKLREKLATTSAGSAAKEQPPKIEQQKRKAITDGKDAKRRRQEWEEEAKQRDRERERRKQELTEPAHHILFVEGLPADATEDPAAVASLFQDFVGFREVRIPPGRDSIAFVEFDSPENARMAKAGLQDYKIDATHKLSISYSAHGKQHGAADEAEGPKE
eukprot:TRINITY_DN1764_c0_g1_i1.p1 TRINITY_DN1764_c0_g1~~TRINITY_DN1764_c0_g1_i1.p1  ORF type:complete len:273 (-),score=87.96 TRINITY_DN1764_c0_g1_i1:651-1469(-)